MLSGSVENYVLEHLGADDRYKQALSGTQDENARKQIDLTVRTFTSDLAKIFDGMLKSLEDPEVRAKFIEGRKK